MNNTAFYGLGLAALLAAAGTAYHAGYRAAALKGEAEKERIVGEWQKQAAASAQAYIAALKQAQAEQQRQRERADRLGVELAAARRQIDIQTASIEQEIPHAVEQDGSRFNGLGDDSLRLYKRALGY